MKDFVKFYISGMFITKRQKNRMGACEPNAPIHIYIFPKTNTFYLAESIEFLILLVLEVRV